MTGAVFEQPGPPPADSPFDLPNAVAAAPLQVSTDDGWTITSTHHLLDLVQEYDRADPRSAQRHIGPSEIGSPCVRKLALKSLHAPQAPYRIAWRTRVGTAVHAWLAGAVGAASMPGELLTEARLYLDGEGDDMIAGSADVVLLRGPDGRVEVVDWKVTGPTTLKDARRGRIKVGYRKQGLIYGLLLEETYGITPTHVTVIVLPAAGEFRDAVVATRPYDRAEALEAVERYKKIRAKAQRYGLAETLRRNPPTEDDFCSGCDYFGVKVHFDDLSDGTLPYDAPGELTLCRGDSAEKAAAAERMAT